MYDELYRYRIRIGLGIFVYYYLKMTISNHGTKKKKF